MGGRRFGWMLAPVPWAQDQQWIRGWHDGLPLLSRHCAPRTLLATRRQLRHDWGRRPGGADPVAVLVTKHRPSMKCNFSSLWLLAESKPLQAMSTARWDSIRKATAARRVCRECGEIAYRDLPRPHRACDPCRSALGLLTDGDDVHDYLAGDRTLGTDTAHARLDTELGELFDATYWGDVVPLPRPPGAAHQARAAAGPATRMEVSA